MGSRSSSRRGPRTGPRTAIVGAVGQREAIGSADVCVRRLDECASAPAYDAELVFVRAALGVESFGMQVERLPAHYSAYAEHDEAESGQEEVYIALSGRARLSAGGAEYTLEPGVFARVGPHVRRKIVTDDSPVVLLCLGGTPGRRYEPPAWSDPDRRPTS